MLSSPQGHVPGPRRMGWVVVSRAGSLCSRSLPSGLWQPLGKVPAGSAWSRAVAVGCRRWEIPMFSVLVRQKRFKNRLELHNL